MVMTLCSLMRYPLKSSLGESLDSTRIEHEGVQFDRNWAVLDQVTGMVASAKNPHRWAALLSLSAKALEGRLSVNFPDGSQMWGPSTALDSALSDHLGRPVHVIGQPPDNLTIERIDPDLEGELSGPVYTSGIGDGSGASGFFDYAPIHIVTTSSLDYLGGVPAARFRPNMVLECTESGIIENDWSNWVLRGREVTLQVLFPAPRCVVPTLAQGGEPGLERDTSLIKALNRHNRLSVAGLPAQPCAGVYARVLTPGVVSAGETWTAQPG